MSVPKAIWPYASGKTMLFFMFKLLPNIILCFFINCLKLYVKRLYYYIRTCNPAPFNRLCIQKKWGIFQPDIFSMDSLAVVTLWVMQSLLLYCCISAKVAYIRVSLLHSPDKPDFYMNQFMCVCLSQPKRRLLQLIMIDFCCMSLLFSLQQRLVSANISQCIDPQ